MEVNGKARQGEERRLASAEAVTNRPRLLEYTLQSEDNLYRTSNSQAI